MNRIVALGLVAAIVGVALALWALRPPPGDAVLAPRDPGDAAAVRVVVLERVSNASGLELVTRDGQRVVATVDEVDAWEGPGAPPPLITFSDPRAGHYLGGEGSAGAFGEVEALAATAAGVLRFSYKTDAQRVVLREGDRDVPLVEADTIARLQLEANKVTTGPTYFEFEGMATTSDGGVALLVAVVDPGARETPRSTKAILLLTFSAQGTLQRLTPPFRWPDGRLYTDYAAALDLTPEGLAIVPGFFEGGVAIIDPTSGRVLRWRRLPTRRVEGVKWDPEAHELYLVRECPGEGEHCAPGAPFGTPLWIAWFPNGL